MHARRYVSGRGAVIDQRLPFPRGVPGGDGPDAKASGIATAPPQFGQRPRLPAISSLTRSFFPHFGQAMLIGMAYLW